MKNIKLVRNSSWIFMIGFIGLVVTLVTTNLYWYFTNSNIQLSSFLFDVLAPLPGSISAILFLVFLSLFVFLFILGVILLLQAKSQFRKELVNPHNLKFQYIKFLFPWHALKLEQLFLRKRFSFIEESLSGNDRIDILVQDPHKEEKQIAEKELVYEENKPYDKPITVYPMDINETNKTINFQNTKVNSYFDTDELKYDKNNIYDTNIILEEENKTTQQTQNISNANTFERSFNTQENYYNPNYTQSINMQDFANQRYYNYYANNPIYQNMARNNISNKNTQYVSLNPNLYQQKQTANFNIGQTQTLHQELPNINEPYKGNQQYTNSNLGNLQFSPFINPKTGQRISHPYQTNAYTRQVELQKQLHTLEFLYKSGQITPSEYYIRRHQIVIKR